MCDLRCTLVHLFIQKYSEINVLWTYWIGRIYCNWQPGMDLFQVSGPTRAGGWMSPSTPDYRPEGCLVPFAEGSGQRLLITRHGTCSQMWVCVQWNFYFVALGFKFYPPAYPVSMLKQSFRVQIFALYLYVLERFSTIMTGEYQIPSFLPPSSLSNPCPNKTIFLPVAFPSFSLSFTFSPTLFYSSFTIFSLSFKLLCKKNTK